MRSGASSVRYLISMACEGGRSSFQVGSQDPLFGREGVISRSSSSVKEIDAAAGHKARQSPFLPRPTSHAASNEEAESLSV